MRRVGRQLDQVRQNRPSLIADDLVKHSGIARANVMEALLSRGVFKWLAARQELIRLKDKWRGDIAQLHGRLDQLRRAEPHIWHPRVVETLGRHRAAVKVRLLVLTECREAVRRICKMPRLSAPDNDHEAMAYLSQVVTRGGPANE